MPCTGATGATSGTGNILVKVGYALLYLLSLVETGCGYHH